MGGYGSGRWGSRKPKAEHMKRLDLARLRRDLLRPGTASKLVWSCGDEVRGSIGFVAHGDALRLVYRTREGDGPWSAVDQAVRLEWTQTRFGGHRPWFRCPGCDRRCRILYAGSRFRCRQCCGLRYASQSETRSDRANRGMFKIVRRLEPSAQVNELPSKPKGMHWRTYDRLAVRYAAYDRQWAMEAIRMFGRSQIR